MSDTGNTTSTTPKTNVRPPDPDAPDPDNAIEADGGELDLSAFGIDASNNDRDDSLNKSLVQHYLDREDRSGGAGPEPGTDTTRDEAAPPDDPETPVDSGTGYRKPADGQGQRSGASGGDPAAPGATDGSATKRGGEGEAQSSGVGEQPPPPPSNQQGQQDDQGQQGQQQGQEDQQQVQQVEWGGQTYDAEAMTRMTALDEWAKSLDQDATAAVNAVLGGSHVVVDRQTAQRWVQYEQERGQGAPAPQSQQSAPQPQYQQPVAPQAPYQQPQPQQPPTPYAPQVAPPPRPDPFANVDLSALDPEVVQVMRQQQATIDQMAQQQAMTVQQQQQYQQQQFDQQQEAQRVQLDQDINAAKLEFGTEFGLPAPQVEQLLDRVARMQSLPGYMTSTGGDLRASVKAALQDAAWTDPNLRQTMLTATDLAQQQQDIQGQQQTRQQKAGALSGGGGSQQRPVTPGTPAGGQQQQDPAKMNGSQRQAAMAQELAQAQAQGQP